MARPGGKRRPCSAADAGSRLRKAHQFRAIAATANDDADLRSAYVSNLVMAGIAAADVICCLRTGHRSADGDHSRAVDLLEEIDEAAANRLKSLLALKNVAAYGTANPNAQQARTADRHAAALIARAEEETQRAQQ